MSSAAACSEPALVMAEATAGRVEALVAFAGDWLSPEEGETYASVETALGSGLAAAEQILRAEAEEAEASGRAAPKL